MDQLNSIIDYYSSKVLEHGPTSKGVDWNGLESQYLRFDILSKIIPKLDNISLLDYGCGYGEYINYINQCGYNNIEYTGFDLSSNMLSQAQDKFPNNIFIDSLPSNAQFDYTLISGLFNIKLDSTPEEWEDYIFRILDEVNLISKKGFCFNILTSYSDEEYKKDYLYYASPEKLFTYCKNNFSKHVCLDHSYPLYEFSIFVVK